MPIVITSEMMLLISLGIDAAVRRIILEAQEMSAEQRKVKIVELKAEKVLIDAEFKVIMDAQV